MVALIVAHETREPEPEPEPEPQAKSQRQPRSLNFPSGGCGSGHGGCRRQPAQRGFPGARRPGYDR